MRIKRFKIANPIELATGMAYPAFPTNRAVRLLAAFFYLPVWLLLKVSWSVVKLVLYGTAFLVFTSVLYVIMGIPFFHSYSTNETILDDSNSYLTVADEETINIVRYLGGCGQMSGDFELQLVRDSIRARYLNAGATPPENFETYSMEELEKLVATWTDEQGFGIPRIVFDRAFAEFSAAAVESPSESPGERTCKQIWQELEEHDFPDIRFVERQNDFISMLIAFFAPRGSQQGAYLPQTHTVYIRYDDSLEVLEDELGHVRQFRERPYESHGKWLQGIFRSARCAPSGALTGSQRAYQNEYDRIGSFEYEAHRLGESSDNLQARERDPNKVLPYHPRGPVRSGTSECP